MGAIGPLSWLLLKLSVVNSLSALKSGSGPVRLLPFKLIPVRWPSVQVTPFQLQGVLVVFQPSWLFQLSPPVLWLNAIRAKHSAVSISVTALQSVVPSVGATGPSSVAVPTWRMRWLLVSEMRRLPLLSNATFDGL